MCRHQPTLEHVLTAENLPSSGVGYKVVRTPMHSFVKITLCFVLMLIAACSKNTANKSNKDPITIGVMLPLSGAENVGWKDVLEWERDALNFAGGVEGRPINLSFRDTAQEDVNVIAADFLRDDSIAAVIGPMWSRDVMTVAPNFIDARKVLVSPASSAAEVFRAFAGKRYIWRTVEADFAQIKAMFVPALRSEASTVALITANDPYGATFFNWFGFFATELGLDVADLVRVEPNDVECADAITQATAASPDWVMVIPSNGEFTLCVAQQFATLAPDSQFIFSDAGRLPELIHTLGDAANGIIGTSLSEDPSSGFAEAYQARFGTQVGNYAASTYDALLILAYGLTLSHGKSGPALATALEQMATHDGDEQLSWQGEDLKRVLGELHHGTVPNFSGTTGPLRFLPDVFMDLASSTYALWRIEEQQFVVSEYLYTADESEQDSSGTSIDATFSQYASLNYLQIDNDVDDDYEPAQRTGVWAMIASTSSTFDNYRHQADALAIYQEFKSNGVPDDHIIFIVDDSFMRADALPYPVPMRNEAHGQSLYNDTVEVDYQPVHLSADRFLSILEGVPQEGITQVVDSTASDDVFVFWVGHGNSYGLFLDNEALTIDSDISVALITDESLQSTLQRKFDAHGFRRMFIAVEACQSGALGAQLDVPGVFLMTGANPYEDSLSTNYDTSLRTFLADQFAYQLQQQMQTNATASMAELYTELYSRVPGAHVTGYNMRRFGSLENTFLWEFIAQ